MSSDKLLTPCIGVFDSGVGGLSVLNAIRRRLPDAPLVYLGDVAYAPYGEREPHDVIQRSQRVVAHLVGQGASVIVVACNTASVLGIAAMRAEWPSLTFVGVEPGVKPAAHLSKTRRIAVMATPATAASERLRQLIDTHARGVHVQILSCPGLAATIERGMHEGDELDAVLEPLCATLRSTDVDTVVLGCTHYPFVARRIRELVGAHVTLIDTASAVAERVAVVWGDQRGLPRQLRVAQTGASPAMATLLGLCNELEPVEIDTSPI